MTHTCVYVHIYLVSDVYLSLDDVVIPTHGYVVIDDIGSDGTGTPLLCNTNRHPPSEMPANSGGYWISPTDIMLDTLNSNSDTVPGFARNRGPMVVRLWRDSDTGTPAEGIYRCEVMDATDMVQTVYVGLYNDDGGGNVLYV